MDRLGRVCAVGTAGFLALGLFAVVTTERDHETPPDPTAGQVEAWTASRTATHRSLGTFERVGSVSVDLGERSNGCPLQRELVLYRASGFDPLPRTGDWVDRFEDETMDAPPPCPAQN